MLEICLVFWKTEPQYTYKRYAYKKRVVHILQAVLYFEQHLAPFYRFFCKKANLGDIDLKFSESLLDINIKNSSKFLEFSMPKICISKNWDFQNFCL